MKASPRAFHLIKEFEGLACEKYRDVGGKWTIGYGHLIRKGEALDKVDEGDAVRILCDDLADVEGCINDCVVVPLTQNQFDALCSFVFNCGCGALRRSTLLKHLNAGDTAKAADELPKWSRVGTRQIDGLLRRRIAEQLLFRSS